MVKMSNHYVAPAILQEGRLELETPILENSVVETMTVKTVGQKVKDWDFSAGGEDNPFNHEWE